jgi:peptidoglycan/LPS O-acetylase OafA/YrhL
LAPLLFIKNRKYIYYIFIASLLIRIYLLQHGKAEDPWSYRFFPSELALFMLGAMAYSLYKKIRFDSNPELFQNLGAIMLTLVVGYIFFFRNIAANYEFDKGIFYLMLAAFIPFIFYLSKDNKFDQFIGNLSYPIYLLWGLRIDITPKIMSLLNSQNQDIEGLVRYSSITIMAVAIYFLIEKPMERIRDRFKH